MRIGELIQFVLGPWSVVLPATDNGPLLGSISMRQTFTFHSAGQLVFGRGAVRELGEIARRLRARRVIVVTDRTLITAGVLDQVRPSLAEAGLTVGVFDRGAPETTLTLADYFAPAGRQL